MSTELMPVSVQSKEQMKLALNDYFTPFREKAAEWLEKAKEIKVTDRSQKDLMKAARIARLAIREQRINVDKKHKELKERALREGQVLDEIKRELTGLIEPTESYLQEQEDFEENEIKKEKEKLFLTRFELLRPFIGEEAKKIMLGELSEESFQAMLVGYQAAKEQREAQEKEAAAQRQKQTEDFEAEQKKIREENDKLRQQNEANEKKLAKEKEKRKALEKQEADRKEAEARAERERIANDRKAKRAPDKVKILAMIDSLDEWCAQLPDVHDSDAKAIVIQVSKDITKIQTMIKLKAAEL